MEVAGTDLVWDGVEEMPGCYRARKKSPGPPSIAAPYSKWDLAPSELPGVLPLRVMFHEQKSGTLLGTRCLQYYLHSPAFFSLLSKFI